MKPTVILIVTSLLAILLALLHLADDIVRGIEPGGPATFIGVLIVAVWLYAVLGLAEGRVRYVIILLFSIGGAAMSYVHMRGAGLVGGRIAGSSGVFAWVFILLALGVTSVVAALLSAHGLWSLRARSRTHRNPP